MNKKAYDLETVPLACMTILIVFLDSVMLVAGAQAATSLPKSKPLVAFENQRLSVQAGEVPLKDLLSEIQAKSGIVIELKDSEAAAKLWSVDFKTLPPVLAFQSILRDLNFAFFYSGTRLARVLILAPGDRTPTANSRLMNSNLIGRRFPTVENAPPKHGNKPKLPGENIKEGDVTTKIEAIEAMEDSHDPKSIAGLGEALTHGHRKVKETALRALAVNKAENVTQMPRRGLNDSDPDFRIEVLEALANRGDLDSLRNALADRNQEVRETAADLLWHTTTQK
jgi:hypothetical protein